MRGGKIATAGHIEPRPTNNKTLPAGPYSDRVGVILAQEVEHAPLKLLWERVVQADVAPARRDPQLLRRLGELKELLGVLERDGRVVRAVHQQERPRPDLAHAVEGLAALGRLVADAEVEPARAAPLEQGEDEVAPLGVPEVAAQDVGDVLALQVRAREHRVLGHDEINELGVERGGHDGGRPADARADEGDAVVLLHVLHETARGERVVALFHAEGQPAHRAVAAPVFAEIEEEAVVPALVEHRQVPQPRPAVTAAAVQEHNRRLRRLRDVLLTRNVPAAEGVRAVRGLELDVLKVDFEVHLGVVDLVTPLLRQLDHPELLRPGRCVVPRRPERDLGDEKSNGNEVEQRGGGHKAEAEPRAVPHQEYDEGQQEDDEHRAQERLADVRRLLLRVRRGLRVREVRRVVDGAAGDECLAGLLSLLVPLRDVPERGEAVAVERVRVRAELEQLGDHVGVTVAGRHVQQRGALEAHLAFEEGLHIGGVLQHAVHAGRVAAGDARGEFDDRHSACSRSSTRSEQGLRGEASENLERESVCFVGLWRAPRDENADQ
mmetsp:Transcript_34110/g.105414  ORF Transcript_34110/g.105414 Transcript_34110/m.105414 type:complete len:550 (-) Transcript_34110:17-1666(-)|eukprot:CAMPEP_0174856588 /NCGR_PEP_ID=MMETSP1114-20130205/36115_1 /TAXON_ID=312471 /ORGANISM="Neobodo designis, Strain CCAP 1951/1" /LENGTH=549 /DNA_ID=CAMNT_0016091391 /DNA_START=113 /DNA_END=1762 /DNA_ORIENTATION=+